MPDRTLTETDPRALKEKPPFDERRQQPPGTEHQMQTRPDHGGDSKSDTMERPTQPAELAPAYVFLASGESTYVTGSVMDLTGGKKLP